MSGFRLKLTTHRPKENRYALLIGVSSYNGGNHLKTPLQDIALVADSLRARGFDCKEILDPDYEDVEDAVTSFARRMADTDIGIIFFAGHAYEHAGDGAILLKDFPFSATGSKLCYFGYPIARLEDAFRRCRGFGILILDACRTHLDNYEDHRLWAEGAERFRSISDHRELVVAWSTSSGAQAWDGSEQNSLFASSFSALARNHQINIDELFSGVGRKVESGSHGQRPWYKSSLTKAKTLSDLPRYVLSATVHTPIPARASPLWLSRNHDGSRLLACGGTGSLFEIKATMPSAIARTPNDAVAADWLSIGVAIVDNKPSMVLRGGSPKGDVNLLSRPFGVRASPNSKTILTWEEDGVELFSITGRGPVLLKRWPLSWWPYGAAYQNDEIAWIVGSDGHIARLNTAKVEFALMTLENPYAGHLYDVAVLENNDLIVTAGGGTIRRLRPQSGKPAVLQAISGPRPDKAERQLETPALGLIFVQHYGDFDMLFCDVAPGSPLLAVTGIGHVLLVDVRDGAEVGRLDLNIGGIYIEGVAFLNNGTLAVLGTDAIIRYFRPIPLS